MENKLDSYVSEYIPFKLIESQPETRESVDLSKIKRVASKDIRNHVKVGEGNSGVVYEGTWRGAVVAVKYPKAKIDSQAMFENELDISQRIGVHPNVPSFFGAVIADGVKIKENCLLMQYMTLGSVEDYFITRTTLGKQEIPTMGQALQTARGAAAGLAHLHEEGIIHRDVAARNFLVEKGRSMCTARICDFGLSRVLPLHNGIRAELGHAASGLLFLIDTNSTHTPLGEELCVSMMDPASLAQGTFSRETDVYSFGCFLYELFVGAPPFANADNRARPEFPKELDPIIVSLIDKCWAEDHKVRLNMADVVTRLEVLSEHYEHRTDVLPRFQTSPTPSSMLPASLAVVASASTITNSNTATPHTPTPAQTPTSTSAPASSASAPTAPCDNIVLAAVNNRGLLKNLFGSRFQGFLPLPHNVCALNYADLTTVRVCANYVTAPRFVKTSERVEENMTGYAFSLQSGAYALVTVMGAPSTIVPWKKSLCAIRVDITIDLVNNTLNSRINNEQGHPTVIVEPMRPHFQDWNNAGLGISEYCQLQNFEVVAETKTSKVEMKLQFLDNQRFAWVNSRTGAEDTVKELPSGCLWIKTDTFPNWMGKPVLELALKQSAEQK